MANLPGYATWKTTPPLNSFPLVDVREEDTKISRAQERLLQAVQAWRDSEENPRIDAEESAVATVRYLADQHDDEREDFYSGLPNETEKELLRKAVKAFDRYISFIARAAAEAFAPDQTTEQQGGQGNE
jgi:hypothetical protein